MLLPVVVCYGQKSFSVLGDSYSTFAGYIPDGYAIWYDNNVKANNDVCAVEQTWWSLLAERTGMELIQNNSYSGSTVCNTGYGGADYSDRSFITRMPMTLEGCPDVLLIFGATNDSWSNAPMGELKFSDWTSEDLYQALPAYCYMLDWYKHNAKYTRVICILNDGLKDKITYGIIAACEHYDTDYILLDGIDKGDGHPTVAGMRQICDAVHSFLKTF